MNTDLYRLKAFNPELGLRDVTLEVREVGDDFSLSCKLPLTGELITGRADDCFAALQCIRREAEGRNWMICCKGSRRDVWLSAMSRSMGGGVKAYVLEMGRHGRLDSMVEIFEEDPPASYSTVADQEAYARAWFESLR